MIEKTISVPQAAALMGVTRQQALKRLTKLNARYPSLGILQRPVYDANRCNYKVSISALRRILLNEESMSLSEVSARVGFTETDLRTLTSRLGRIESRIDRIETERFRGR